MEQAGLYIHVPFCRSKCPYCGFYSIASRRLVPRWMDAAGQEMAQRRASFPRFDTLYMGGGTPSALEDGQIEALLKRARSCFLFAGDAEVSIEANPGDVTKERAQNWKSLGFNRVTVGVQSFDNRDLSLLGRRHTAEDAKKALDHLREAGWTRVGLDLIYGISGQSEAGWIESLKTALAFSPEHLSCYELTIETGTLFQRHADRGRLSSIHEDDARAFFLATSRFLEDRGYLHYEISNFARGSAGVSRHNRKYWRRVPYLGIGPSAHSFEGNRRRWNVASVREYCEALERGVPPAAGEERLSREQSDLERIALGLRMREGLDLRSIRELEKSEEMLQRLASEGLVRMEGQRLIPTREGYAVADALPLYLFHSRRRPAAKR